MSIFQTVKKLNQQVTGSIEQWFLDFFKYIEEFLPLIDEISISKGIAGIEVPKPLQGSPEFESIKVLLDYETRYTSKKILWKDHDTYFIVFEMFFWFMDLFSEKTISKEYREKMSKLLKSLYGEGKAPKTINTTDINPLFPKGNHVNKGLFLWYLYFQEILWDQLGDITAGRIVDFISRWDDRHWLSIGTLTPKARILAIQLINEKGSPKQGKNGKHRGHEEDAFDNQKRMILYCLTHVLPRKMEIRPTSMFLRKQISQGDIDATILLIGTKMGHFQFKSTERLGNNPPGKLLDALIQLFQSFQKMPKDPFYVNAFYAVFEGYTNDESANQIEFLEGDRPVEAREHWEQLIWKKTHPNESFPSASPDSLKLRDFIERTSFIFTPERHTMENWLEDKLGKDILRNILGQMVIKKKIEDPLFFEQLYPFIERTNALITQSPIVLPTPPIAIGNKIGPEIEQSNEIKPQEGSLPKPGIEDKISEEKYLIVVQMLLEVFERQGNSDLFDVLLRREEIELNQGEKVQIIEKIFLDFDKYNIELFPYLYELFQKEYPLFMQKRENALNLRAILFNADISYPKISELINHQWTHAFSSLLELLKKIFGFSGDLARQFWDTCLKEVVQLKINDKIYSDPIEFDSQLANKLKIGAEAIRKLNEQKQNLKNDLSWKNYVDLEEGKNRILIDQELLNDADNLINEYRKSKYKHEELLDKAYGIAKSIPDYSLLQKNAKWLLNSIENFRKTRKKKDLITLTEEFERQKEKERGQQIRADIMAKKIEGKAKLQARRESGGYGD